MRFSPRCVTRTTRESLFRATQPSSTNRVNNAAPSAPARCGFRSVQSRQRRANVAAPAANCFNIHSNLSRKNSRRSSQFVFPFAASTNRSRRFHAQRQIHRDDSSQMVVARPRHANVRPIRKPRIVPRRVAFPGRSLTAPFARRTASDPAASSACATSAFANS